jgi:hypothetical protein
MKLIRPMLPSSALWGAFGSSIIVHTIYLLQTHGILTLGINFGFWALKLLILQKKCYKILF